MLRKKSPPSRRRLSDRPEVVETRAAEFMMAGWGVALLTTLICEVAAALLYLYTGLQPASPSLQILTGMFHFAAAVVGLIALAMIPMLFKVRHQPPAPPVVALALLISGLPLLGLALRLFFG
jgi:hypothetical protein